MDDHLVEAAAPPCARRKIARWVLWKGLNVPKNKPMPPLGATIGAHVRQQADAEQQRAQPKAEHQEGLAREGQAGGAERGQDDVERRRRPCTLRLASPMPRANR